MQNNKSLKCPICGMNVMAEINEEHHLHIYNCPVCGRLEYYQGVSDFSTFDINKLRAFLAYNGYPNKDEEVRYFSFRSKKNCTDLKKLYKNGKLLGGYPVHLDVTDVNNWYPDTFAEKIDNILLWLDAKTSYWGETLKLHKEEAIGHLFIEQHMGVSLKSLEGEDILKAQFKYVVDYLIVQGFISAPNSWTGGTYDRPIVLSPNGYARIDELNKRKSHDKTAFVAMQFGEETSKLREAIREGIQKAGYVAVFIDEVEHNDFITPELLKYIREAKFVVDLTHKNNGAYFEEGYALGLGKTVIQLCQRDTKLHFDIAQKNTIIWTTEAEIPIRLESRINATVE